MNHRKRAGAETCSKRAAAQIACIKSRRTDRSMMPIRRQAYTPSSKNLDTPSRVTEGQPDHLGAQDGLGLTLRCFHERDPVELCS